MAQSIFTNSYFILIVLFIGLCAIFYLFEWGFYTETDVNGNTEKKFSWYIPLAISLVGWLIFHFIVYPQDENTKIAEAATVAQVGGLGNYYPYEPKIGSVADMPIKTDIWL